jgi:hypothetical protein
MDKNAAEAILSEKNGIVGETFTPSELATIRADMAECEREALINAAAKRVADAAVGWTMAYTLKMRFILAEAAGDASADAAYRVMVGVVFEAQNAFSDAVREYRALTEPQEKENSNENHA